MRPGPRRWMSSIRHSLPSGTVVTRDAILRGERGETTRAGITRLADIPGAASPIAMPLLVHLGVSSAPAYLFRAQRLFCDEGALS